MPACGSADELRRFDNAAVADHRLERHYAEHQSVSPRRMLTGVRLLAIVVVHFEG